MYTTTTNVSVIKYPLYIMQNALMIMVGLQLQWYHCRPTMNYFNVISTTMVVLMTLK